MAGSASRVAQSFQSSVTAFAVMPEKSPGLGQRDFLIAEQVVVDELGRGQVQAMLSCHDDEIGQDPVAVPPPKVRRQLGRCFEVMNASEFRLRKDPVLNYNPSLLVHAGSIFSITSKRYR